MNKIIIIFHKMNSYKMVTIIKKAMKMKAKEIRREL
jgi:hypothetical protein